MDCIDQLPMRFTEESLTTLTARFLTHRMANHRGIKRKSYRKPYREEQAEIFRKWFLITWTLLFSQYRREIAAYW